jgi:hypothetical protein
MSTESSNDPLNCPSIKIEFTFGEFEKAFLRSDNGKDHRADQVPPPTDRCPKDVD